MPCLRHPSTPLAVPLLHTRTFNYGAPLCIRSCLIFLYVEQAALLPSPVSLFASRYLPALMAHQQLLYAPFRVHLGLLSLRVY